MKIKVLQKDIREAKRFLKKNRSRSCNCPIALAIKRITGKKALVCYYSGGPYIPIDAMPKSARDFIHRFDDGEPVRPFTFQLPL